MRVGTKSVLFGVHAFWLHPWFVAAAWWKLYGFPWDPRLWVAFFVHDLGYWGKVQMDDEEGERHPEWGARVMSFLFDPSAERVTFGAPWTPYSISGGGMIHMVDSYLELGRWGCLTLFHSRFLAKRYGQEPSRLCVADKLLIVITPFWLYHLLGRMSGEIWEYMELCGDGKYRDMNPVSQDPREWFAEVQRYCREWVEANRDGGPDTMTPAQEEAG